MARLWSKRCPVQKPFGRHDQVSEFADPAGQAPKIELASGMGWFWKNEKRPLSLRGLGQLPR